MTGVGPGCEVLLPAFICRDVLASINHLGASAVFYQVDRSLSPLELVKRDSIKAVIAVNYFGFPQDLEPFISYANETGVGIVEDNAHGWLSKDSEGRLLGLRTAVGITSFRKTIRVVDGAVLHVSDHANNSVSPQQVNTNIDLLPLAFRIRRFSARIERKSGIPFCDYCVIQRARYARSPVVTRCPNPVTSRKLTCQTIQDHIKTHLTTTSR